jgi:hypothetical protein
MKIEMHLECVTKFERGRTMHRERDTPTGFQNCIRKCNENCDDDAKC